MSVYYCLWLLHPSRTAIINKNSLSTYISIRGVRWRIHTKVDSTAVRGKFAVASKQQRSLPVLYPGVEMSDVRTSMSSRMSTSMQAMII